MNTHSAAGARNVHGDDLEKRSSPAVNTSRLSHNGTVVYQTTNPAGPAGLSVSVCIPTYARDAQPGHIYLTSVLGM